jgi:hypothetical protein
MKRTNKMTKMQEDLFIYILYWSSNPYSLLGVFLFSQRLNVRHERQCKDLILEIPLFDLGKDHN